jgi:hypothetical protein
MIEMTKNILVVGDETQIVKVLKAIWSSRVIW